MIVENLRQNKRPLQKCPLCGELQDNNVAGVKPHPTESDKAIIDFDRGYSFCNCKNIWYTDWSNMRQEVYDGVYTDKYRGTGIDNAIYNYFGYYQIIKEIIPNGSILEVGCVNPTLLNEFRKKGWTTYALDVIDHSNDERFNGHRVISEDFELLNTDIKFDMVWASHVWEHFKDPVWAINKAKDLLNIGGLLFVSMPDPYFIDFQDVHRWGHWHIEEHHVMWDMGSFCNVLEDEGFEIIVARHNVDSGYICNCDQHILARKK